MTAIGTRSASHAHYSGLPLLLKRVFRQLEMAEFGQLDVVIPNRGRFRFTGTKPGAMAEFIITDMRALRRISAGDVGLAEAYLQGEWDTHDLTSLLQFLGENQHLIAKFTSKWFFKVIQQTRHWLNRNTRRGSKKNIRAHYDLGNSFYQQWLDPSMTYSSALGLAEDLERGQDRKYAAIIEAANITADQHVLEIGCGWGGFAEYAARHIGCKITALTISKAQFDFAVERIRQAGLSDKVNILLCDYRDVQGQYDAIVSIEMFEAVGEAFWPEYFSILRQKLRAGGKAALQVITIREDIFPRYRTELDFIRSYIFPGGMLPTPTILEKLGEAAGLNVHSDRAFGADYAKTCAIWRQNFQNAWANIEKMGFDQRFYRMWNYYLCYCEAGFLAKTIDVHQIAFQAPAQS